MGPKKFWIYDFELAAIGFVALLEPIPR